MAVTLTEKDISELKDAFAIFDKDNDGFIRKAEMRDILISLGKDGTEEEVRKVLEVADTDGDGMINFPEFLNMMANNLNQAQVDAENQLEHMFKIIDRDQDGFITHSEMKRAIEEMGDTTTDAEVNEMIRKADSDGDGKLTFEEFSAIMKDTHSGQFD